MDCRLRITTTEVGLAIEATEAISDAKICCPGFIVHVGIRPDNFSYPSLIVLHNEEYFIMDPLTLLNHSCLSTNFLSQPNQFQSISATKAKFLLEGFDSLFTKTFDRCKYLYLKLNETVFPGEIFINYNADISLEPYKTGFRQLGFICQCTRCRDLPKKSSSMQ
jgi:hypothetical protein